MDESTASHGVRMPLHVRSPVPQTHHLRAWRKHKKVTLAALAEAIGSTKGHMSNIEQGRTNLTRATAEAIARRLGIDVETLYRREPSEEADLEQDLLALFRGGDDVQQRAMVDMARTIRAMDRRPARDHDDTSSASETEPG